MAAADDTGSENVDSDIDVAIVGAGPGGLATAAAIFSASGKHTRVKERPCRTSALAQSELQDMWSLLV